MKEGQINDIFPESRCDPILPKHQPQYDLSISLRMN